IWICNAATPPYRTPPARSGGPALEPISLLSVYPEPPKTPGARESASPPPSKRSPNYHYPSPLRRAFFVPYPQPDKVRPPLTERARSACSPRHSKEKIMKKITYLVTVLALAATGAAGADDDYRAC